ncbi:phage tail tube protein [Salipiger abyssi]|uniref:Phage major tail protein, TP901-1 family n=1 Tax=Salipiger abyssi TaxID=1250539 RepID=A0A1P8UPD9_9RHOB|nr:phage tail tube protein [Salipiger abyssi]APZ51227.1 phage major tail protein, TP901-1 family [Salipiger abyssi]
MATQKGRLLLVKIGDGQETEQFSTLCGLREKTFGFSVNESDATQADYENPGGQIWTRGVSGARRLNVSGTGLFEDHATLERMRSICIGSGPADTVDAVGNFQVIVPGDGTYEAEFHVSQFERVGPQEGEITYSLTMASNGPPAFTAEA